MIEVQCPLTQCFQKGRRGVGFLVMPDNDFVNAMDAFHELRKKEQDRVWTNFRRWIVSFQRDIRGVCHGFDMTQYEGRFRDCHQFEMNQYFRFYGFLSHPIVSDPRFYFFTAAHFLEKHRWRVQESVLEKIILLSKREDIKNAVTRYVESMLGK